MPWNSDGPGPSPWGTPPNDNDKRAGNGPREPNRGPNRGPWGGGGGNNGMPQLPDLDRLLQQAQAWLRRLLPGQGGGIRGVLLAAIALLAIWLATGFYRVEPDEQGVVLRFGALNRTTPPGLNYHLPWPVETVLLPPVTRINRIDIGYRSNPIDAAANGGRDLPVREVPEESLMLTGDENIIDINFSVFWKVKTGDVGQFLFDTRNPAQTVKSASESVMREVIGSTPIQPALAEARARIETSVLAGTQAILDQYKAGVEITQIQLQRVDPPAAVIDSFRDVQRANTDAERMRNEAQSYANDIVPRARGDAARVVAEAEGARQSSIAEATGQAQRFLSVLAAYEASRDITLRRLYIDTMQDILTHTPSVVVDDQIRGILPLLPLDPAGTALPAIPVAPSTPAAPPQAPPPIASAPRSLVR
jgi:membrane protease subunit HflK